MVSRLGLAGSTSPSMAGLEEEGVVGVVIARVVAVGWSAGRDVGAIASSMVGLVAILKAGR